jgi:hypothetical protein
MEGQVPQFDIENRISLFHRYSVAVNGAVLKMSVERRQKNDLKVKSVLEHNYCKAERHNRKVHLNQMYKELI